MCRVVLFSLTFLFCGGLCASQNSNPNIFFDREWIKLSSGEVTLITDSSEECAKKLFGDFESYSQVVRMVTGLKSSGVERPLKIFALKKNKHFNALVSGMGASSNVVGLFFEGDEGAFSLIKVGNCSGKKRSLYARDVLFHEYVHYLSSLSGGALPYWYSEGLADYFSTVSFGGDGTVSLGQLVNRYLRYFEIYGLRYFPTEKLFRIKSAPTKKNDVARIYATGWLLVHYLISDEGLRGRLGDYLTYFNSGMDEGAAFSKAFDFTYKELDKKLRSYVARKRYKYKQITLNRVDLLKEMSVSQLSYSDLLFEIGGMLSAKGFNRKSVSPYFEMSLKLDPSNPRSKAGVASQLLYESPLAAKELIDRIPKGVSDPWVLTIKGEIYSKMAVNSGKGEDGQINIDYANTALRAFRAGLHQPGNIVAMIGVGDLYFRLGYIEKALDTFLSAESYAPMNDSVLRNLFLVYYASDRLADANRIADRYRKKLHRSEESLKEFNKWALRVSKFYSR